jgi:hypothetical protein
MARAELLDRIPADSLGTTYASVNHASDGSILWATGPKRAGRVG